MRRTMTFAKRNLIEVYRDPLSWIFCIAFPIVMLIIMSIVNSAIPKEGMTLFRIDNLAGGIAIFGQMFVMLFTAIAVAKDRNGAFLTRLYSSPMKSSNFVWGYILPMLLTAVIQVCVTLIASVVVSLISSYQLSIAGLLLTIIAVIHTTKNIKNSCFSCATGTHDYCKFSFFNFKGNFVGCHNGDLSHLIPFTHFM